MPTYARAWHPSTDQHNLGEVDLLGWAAPDPDDNKNAEYYVAQTKYMQVGMGGINTPVGAEQANLSWVQTQYDYMEDDHLNSLALTIGLYSTTGWYFLSKSYLGDNATNDFSLNNIASMYKLVPSNVSKDDLTYYRLDPANTLNKIYPRIFKYVSDITPLHMTQQVFNEVESSLNKSDVIAPEQLILGVTPKSVLRKFRIGHELQEQLVYMQKPTPAWDWNNLGYTHTVGTFDDRGPHITTLSKIQQINKPKDKSFSETKFQSITRLIIIEIILLIQLIHLKL